MCKTNKTNLFLRQLIILFILTATTKVFSQSMDKIVVYNPSKAAELETKNYIKTQTLIISLMLYADSLSPINIQSTNVLEYTDRYIICLKSGLKWEIGDIPAPKPNFFLLKAMSEKGRKRPDVSKRIEYIQLVKLIEEKKYSPYKLIEKIMVIRKIILKNNQIQDYRYEFSINKENKIRLITQ